MMGFTAIGHMHGRYGKGPVRTRHPKNHSAKHRVVFMVVVVVVVVVKPEA
jgi:hypothetical protein